MRFRRMKTQILGYVQVDREPKLDWARLAKRNVGHCWSLMIPYQQISTNTKISLVLKQVFWENLERLKIDFRRRCSCSTTRMCFVFSSAGQTPQKMRQLYTSELLDIYCSQCCKKVNLLNDLEARLRNLKANR